MLDDLFESLDSKVFTADVKDKLNEMFNEAVDAKAKVIAESYIEDEKQQLEEAAQDYINQLDEKFSEYCESYKKSLDESINSYLTECVETFVSEKSKTLDTIANNERGKALMNVFEKAVNILGHDINTIIGPSKISEAMEERYNAVKNEYNELVQKNALLESQLKTAVKSGVLSDFSRELSVPQVELINKLSENVEMKANNGALNVEQYISDLLSLKESITSSVNTDDDDDDRTVRANVRSSRRSLSESSEHLDTEASKKLQTVSQLLENFYK